jgi:hypothetical protein
VLNGTVDRATTGLMMPFFCSFIFKKRESIRSQLVDQFENSYDQHGYLYTVHVIGGGKIKIAYIQ